MAVKRFRRQMLGGSPTYTCRMCGKQTRETGHDESSVELCAFCYQCAGMENTYYDQGITWDEYLEAIAQLEKQYKRTLPEADRATKE